MDNRTPYMTAVELGIEQREYEGLIALSRELPLMRHDPEAHGKIGATPRAFNMNIQCGTACCIGGWLHFRGQLGGSVTRPTSVNLSPLFWPENLVHWRGITPTQASCAIINFLVTGDPQWDKVTPEAA